MDNERKGQAICPSCGHWNYKPLTYVRQLILDEFGKEHYIIFSLMKYKCTYCKTVWTERWDYDSDSN